MPEITQEQFNDLKTYIPLSPTVRAVFEELHPEENFTDWDEAVARLVKRALDGERDSLFTLLELTFLSAENEAMLDNYDETVL